MTFDVPRSKAPTLALTSMLDVIFLLLCFFVTVSVFSQWESEIAISLPGAETAQEPERLPGEIVVNLTKDGVVRVNGTTLALDDLQARLARVSKFYPGQPVIIRADRETKYETLVKVIDTCRAADVWNFSLATEGAMKVEVEARGGERQVEVEARGGERKKNIPLSTSTSSLHLNKE